MSDFADNMKKSIVATQKRITQMIYDEIERANAAYREAIIRMAREAQRKDFRAGGGHWFGMEVTDLERFADLVAAEEREALKEERRRDMAEICSLRKSEESLREEVERLRADAERYRWLRNSRNTPEIDASIDAAIDAAMGEKR